MNRFPFARNIHRVPSLQVHGEVTKGAWHKGIAKYARDAEGRAWVLKYEEDVTYTELLAESVCLLMGRRLGAPLPDGALYVEGDRRGWLSKVIRPVMHWDESQRDFIENLDEVAAMLMMDAVAGNVDRHGANVLLEPGDEAPDVRLWAIDQGNALIGQPASFLELGLELADASKHFSGLPLGDLERPVLAVAQVARSILREEVQVWMAECGEIAAEPRWSDLADLLYQRLQAAPDLGLRYLEVLRGKP